MPSPRTTLSGSAASAATPLCVRTDAYECVPECSTRERIARELQRDDSYGSGGTVPRLSAEVFVIPLENSTFIIYAPLRRAAFVANAGLVKFLANLQAGTFEAADDPDGALVEFLRRLEIVDAGTEHVPITRFEGLPDQTSVTLFLTTACNLRCTYCYASAGDTPTKFMSLEIAKRGIDFVARNALRRKASAFEVNFHGGGEPTVNWRTMCAAMEYAEGVASGLGLGVHGSTATNGVLTDERIDWIIAHLRGASVSFDGLPEVHDKHRLTILGQGSSERVMHCIRRFDEADFPYGIRVTVTADQIPRMPASVEFICSHFKARRIQVEPAYQIGRWSGAPSAETADFIEGFREAQVRARQHGKEISFSAARLGVLTNHFCGITRDTFALSPDGNVSACYEVFSEDNPWAKVFFYGQPSTRDAGYEFDLERLDHLRKQGVQHRDYCRGCFAKWTCAGDCYHRSLTVNGSLEFAGSDRCNITRELTKDQILARIAQAGGVFWHEAPTGATATSAGKESLV